MIWNKQDLEDAVSNFEDGILDPAFDGNEFDHNDWCEFDDDEMMWGFEG